MYFIVVSNGETVLIFFPFAKQKELVGKFDSLINGFLFLTFQKKRTKHLTIDIQFREYRINRLVWPSVSLALTLFDTANFASFFLQL